MEIMRNLGSQLEDAQPVDMFPGTCHVEEVVLISKDVLT